MEESDALCCPITHCMLRDPVFVPESGTTYEREVLLNFWRTSAGVRRDVLSNQPLSSAPRVESTLSLPPAGSAGAA